jgi:hypothetical protein
LRQKGEKERERAGVGSDFAGERPKGCVGWVGGGWRALPLAS